MPCFAQFSPSFLRVDLRGFTNAFERPPINEGRCCPLWRSSARRFDQFPRWSSTWRLVREPSECVRRRSNPASWYWRQPRRNGRICRIVSFEGYTVLLPDSRAQGESGGKFPTYGVNETDDVRRWFEWLASQQRPLCIFGMGESMGAAILLQALQGRNPLLCCDR